MKVLDSNDNFLKDFNDSFFIWWLLRIKYPVVKSTSCAEFIKYEHFFTIINYFRVYIFNYLGRVVQLFPNLHLFERKRCVFIVTADFLQGVELVCSDIFHSVDECIATLRNQGFFLNDHIVRKSMCLQGWGSAGGISKNRWYQRLEHSCIPLCLIKIN